MVRQDYSNHWPWITADGDILAVAFDLDNAPLSFSLNGKKETTRPFPCDGHGVYKDVILVLDQNGTLKDKIPIFDGLIKGPYGARFALRGPDAGCDPVHTNSVVPFGPGLAAKLSGVSADDLLISSRSLDALFVLGRNDHQIKHMITGTFRRQHSAKPLPDGRIVLFDNMGSRDDRGPTRILILDPATNQETTFFPNALTAPTHDILAEYQGRIELSRDEKNMVVAYGPNGRGYEIRLADGAVVTNFDNVHDLRTFLPGDDRVEYALRGYQYGIYYVYQDVLSRFAKAQ